MADERVAPLFNTIARHTGAQFEAAAVHRARGTNEQVPGVDVEDAREQTGGFTGGRRCEKSEHSVINCGEKSSSSSSRIGSNRKF